MPRSAWSFVVALILAALAAPTAHALPAQVWTVDAAGGADFSEIQPAVDAASDGDTILIAGGDYGPVSLVNEGLALVGRPGEVVNVHGGVALADTLVEHVVVLANLRLLGSHAVGREQGLSGSVLRGPLRVDGCELRGAAGLDYSFPDEHGGDAVHLEIALDVAFRASTLRGGDGGMSFSGFDQNRGGDALDAGAALLSLHDCELLAGDGGPGDFLGCDFGGAAGHGARLRAGTTLFASGTQFTGGDGGGDDFLACNPGGDGLSLDAASARATLLDTSAAGGLGACGLPDGSGVSAVPGATAQTLAGQARTLASPTPLVVGATADFVFGGAPDDQAFVLLAAAPGQAFLPKFHGTLLLGFPFATNPLFLGVIGPGGSLTKPLTAPALPVGSEALTVFAQAVFRDSGGGLWLGSPTALVLLDAGL